MTPTTHAHFVSAGRASAARLNPSARINAVMAAASGASKVQFIKIEAADSARKRRGRQHAGSACFAGVAYDRSANVVTSASITIP